MTLRKKLLITITALSAVLCILVTGTIAWLTDDTQPITNTFTPSNIEITLTESDNLDLQMVPGKTITKDPKVTVVADSEPCWVFVKIEKTIGITTAGFDTYLTYSVDSDLWSELSSQPGVYYRLVGTDTKDQTFYILKDNVVRVKDTVSKDFMDRFSTADTYPALIFTAYAIQSENLPYTNADAEDSVKAAEAWTILQSSQTTP